MLLILNKKYFISFLGFIIETNSSLMIKDEEGNPQRMIILQKPIPLDQLDIEYEDDTYKCVAENKNVSKVNDAINLKKNLKKELVCFDDIVTLKEHFNVSTNIKGKRVNDSDNDVLLIKNDAIGNDDEKQNDLEICSNLRVSEQIKNELKENSTMILKESSSLYTLECKEKATKQNKVDINEKDSSKPGVSGEPKMEKKNKMTILNKPIPLDSLQCNVKEDEFPFTVRLIKNNKSIRSKEQNCKEFRQWQQNALIIFEFSHVYPFIHATSKYKCMVCYKLFLEAHLLKVHIDNEHTIADLKEKLTIQVKDKNLKVDVSSLRCKICSVTLPTLDELKIHLKNHGKDINIAFKDNIIPFKLNENKFDCQICIATYPKLRLLVKHMNSNHFNNFSCEYCGSQFVSLRLLKSHLQSHEIGSFPCSKCSKVFKSAVYRSNHIRVTHLKHLLRICPYCPERFNSNYNRTKHIRIAHKPNTELFKCETCGKGFDLKYHLRLHIRSVHLQERNFECNVCHLRFFNNYTLSRHTKTHTGDYQFKCQVCGKGYSTKFRLREHCKTHNVICYTCGADCRDHDSLTAHVREVHGGV